jgi:hypothetical protein
MTNLVSAPEVAVRVARGLALEVEQAVEELDRELVHTARRVARKLHRARGSSYSGNPCRCAGCSTRSTPSAKS